MRDHTLHGWLLVVVLGTIAAMVIGCAKTSANKFRMKMEKQTERTAWLIGE